MDHVIFKEEQMNRKTSHQIFRCGLETGRPLKKNKEALMGKGEKSLNFRNVFHRIPCKDDMDSN